MCIKSNGHRFPGRYTLSLLLCLISANLIKQWENPQLLPFLLQACFLVKRHCIELLFELFDTIQGFKPFEVVKVFVEIDKICSSMSLATAWTVSSKVAHLATFEASIVCISLGGSSSIVVQGWPKAGSISLNASSIFLMPIWCSGLAQVHRDSYVIHPMQCIGRVVLYLRRSLLVESWPALVKECFLISLVSLVEECAWSSEVIGTLECVKNFSIESPRSPVWVADTEYIIDQHFQSSG